jgi:transposase
MTHRGAVNGAVFLRFVRTRLVPWLRPGDVVFFDNLNMHKMRLVREAIEAAGATPLYLPTYSPELNPIELFWAHIKRQLRTAACDTAELLGRAVRRERSRTPLTHIDGWFRRARRFAQGK